MRTSKFKRIKKERDPQARQIVASLQPKETDQHAKCDYCGRSYLVSSGSQTACGPCSYIINWLPQPAKAMLDAIVYRLTALETLRQVMESDLNKVTEVRKARIKRLAVMERERRYGRR